MLELNKFRHPILLLFFFIGIRYCYAQVSVDSVFVTWNNRTIGSLERQIKSSSDSVVKSRYENRLSVIVEYWSIRDQTSVNIESIRYKFLKKIFLQQKNKGGSKFYVIEANESGSKVILRNFVVYIDSLNNANIEFYINVNQEWQKQGKCIFNNFHIEYELKNSIAKFRKGINNDDIIVTKFEDNHVQESEYFLYGTLSNISSIKKVLDCYKDENFIR